MITLITGGARSGKSSFGEKIAQFRGGKEVYYLATAEVKDKEMETRVKKHQAQRSEHWTTIEEPLAAEEALSSLPTSAVVLMDCITIYISNLLFEEKAETEAELDKMAKEKYIIEKMEKLVAVIRKKDMEAILVTNEVGQGIVPGNKIGRIYRDIAGRVNQYLAGEAEEVYLTIAGLPLEIKELGRENLSKFREEGEK